MDLLTADEEEEVDRRSRKLRLTSGCSRRLLGAVGIGFTSIGRRAGL
jgi:hypothetical protein